jgi:hypothetical protein
MARTSSAAAAAPAAAPSAAAPGGGQAAFWVMGLCFSAAAYANTNDPAPLPFILAYATAACASFFCAQLALGWTPRVPYEAMPFTMFALILPGGLLVAALPGAAAALRAWASGDAPGGLVGLLEVEALRDAAGMAWALAWLLLVCIPEGFEEPHQGPKAAAAARRQRDAVAAAAAAKAAAPSPAPAASWWGTANLTALSAAAMVAVWAGWGLAVRQGWVAVGEHCRGTVL